MLSVLLNVLLAGRAAKTKQAEVIMADTIVVRDTLRIVETRVVKEEVVRYEKVYLQAIDTIFKIDSIGVIVPITERTYEDSTYKAVVRGYNPELVSLDMYLKEVYFPKIVERKVKPKIVVSAGVYGGFGSKGADYGLGISVGVPIWSW